KDRHRGPLAKDSRARCTSRRSATLLDGLVHFVGNWSGRTFKRKYLWSTSPLQSGFPGVPTVIAMVFTVPSEKRKFAMLFFPWRQRISPAPPPPPTSLLVPAEIGTSLPTLLPAAK